MPAPPRSGTRQRRPRAGRAYQPRSSCRQAGRQAGGRAGRQAAEGKGKAGGRSRVSGAGRRIGRQATQAVESAAGGETGCHPRFQGCIAGTLGAQRWDQRPATTAAWAADDECNAQRPAARVCSLPAAAHSTHHCLASTTGGSSARLQRVHRGAGAAAQRPRFKPPHSPASPS